MIRQHERQHLRDAEPDQHDEKGPHGEDRCHLVVGIFIGLVGEADEVDLGSELRNRGHYRDHAGRRDVHAVLARPEHERQDQDAAEPNTDAYHLADREVHSPANGRLLESVRSVGARLR